MNENWQKKLDTSLQRVQEALAKDERPHSQLLSAVITAASDKAMEQLSRTIDRQQARQLRRQRRREREQSASVPVGAVFAGFALIAIYLGLTHDYLWWMYFVSFGFALSAAGIFGRAMARAANRKQAALGETASVAVASSEAEPPSAIDLRLARVMAICEKILAAIKDGPAAVREIVTRPEETLKALSATCQELARREKELRAAITEDDERRLRSEREGLSARVAEEKDAVVRQRRQSALQALDAQLAQRSELATAASRLEAEGTRILYTLESLHTQVLRARSADAASADVAGAGLRLSLEQLGNEVDAVASALESAHRAELISPVVDPTGLEDTVVRERSVQPRMDDDDIEPTVKRVRADRERS